MKYLNINISDIIIYFILELATITFHMSGGIRNYLSQYHPSICSNFSIRSPDNFLFL